jgi:pimeloyl-ACP methyl ester carboxylesterase
MADSEPQLWGTVSAEHASDHRLVVILYRYDEVGRGHIYDHVTREGPGRFFFVMSPGTWHVAAFVDVNGNLKYDRDEPALIEQDGELTFEMKRNDRRTGIELVIPKDGRAPGDGPVDVRALQARAPADQRHYSLGQLVTAGTVAPLDDPMFSRENADRGLWTPIDFSMAVRPGIYFLQDYEVGKIPILFVHGMGGFPREFEFLIDNLDRKRFQPWVIFYPSGGRLDAAAQVLTDMIEGLRAIHGFQDLYVVAHSMGGLVARAFILDYVADTGRDTIKLFVSMATPWRGMESAAIGMLAMKPLRGKLQGPASWKDVATGSRFLNSLFYEDPDSREEPRPLPESVSFHLFCGCLSGGDKTVPTASAARVDAVRDAGYTIHAFPLGHVAILSSPHVSDRLNEILENAARR